MLNLDIISQKIIHQRKQLGLTQEELAEKLYVTRQAVSKWEMGKSLPSVEILAEMTQLFKVSIDYLLDGSDVKEDDYATMFMQYPRESVIHRFTNTLDLSAKVNQIFYLLTQKERKQMIDQVISKTLNISTLDLWPCLSMTERPYVLSNLLSKGNKEEVDQLYGLLSKDERLMVHHQTEKIMIIHE